MEGTGRPLYPHQDEALIEILAGNHVIAATPTGSGKSMIALAAHFVSMAHGGRSYYTAPLKALGPCGGFPSTPDLSAPFLAPVQGHAGALVQCRLRREFSLGRWREPAYR